MNKFQAMLEAQLTARRLPNGDMAVNLPPKCHIWCAYCGSLLHGAERCKNCGAPRLDEDRHRLKIDVQYRDRLRPGMLTTLTESRGPR